jgi:tetratricopeptide (TPR) repeat protein
MGQPEIVAGCWQGLIFRPCPAVVVAGGMPGGWCGRIQGMAGDLDTGYLARLATDQREALERVNAPGLAALRDYLKSSEVVAFLGAGASVPLYPLWAGLIGELVDAAAGRLSEKQAATCRALAGSAPEEVMEIVRRSLGEPSYRAVLREVLRVRTDPVTGRSWTGVQELVCRCAFRGVVTTNYDPGIVDARMRVRPGASATGFTTWQDELGLDEWRTGRVFGGGELPVLYAHGVHTQPDSVVLAASDYRRAYAGKLARVLERLADGGHLCWIGFSFADQRLAAILREVPLLSGTQHHPGAAPTHVAIMAWDPEAEANEPGVLAQRAEIAYGAQVILYPAPGGDHSALTALLGELANARFPPAGEAPARPALAAAETGTGATAGRAEVVVRWVPPPDPVAHFTGRVEELARLDRWAADPGVRLVGVSAWGGAGKTALVTHWVGGGIARRPGLQGVFGWSFYTDPSAEHWAAGLLEWAQHDLSVPVPATGRPAARVLGVLAAAPVLLVLDGLELVQEGPAGDGFGRLLDGLLREVLTGVCQMECGGLVVLTSRFLFADLEGFDGSSARILELPAFTPAEGAALLAAAGGGWLPRAERRELVAAVDGHALAVTVLAGLLATRLPAASLGALRADLAAAARTDARVGKMLGFYAGRLGDADRYLLAGVSLFTRPVTADTVLTVAAHEAFGGRLAGWTPGMVQAAVRERLAGLASWHPDGTISAHPLVRDTFRPLTLSAAATVVDITLTGLPRGRVTSRADALAVTEAIELLLDAGQWQPAHDLYSSRCDRGYVWMDLPAARLGQRTATAFVATPARREACATHLNPNDLCFYLNAAGLYATIAGDLATARDHLTLVTRHYRYAGNMRNHLAASLLNLAECLGRLGLAGPARDAAAEALATRVATGNWDYVRSSHTFLGWLAGLTGDATAAENHFTTADQIRLTEEGEHLYSYGGVLWTQWLARTGRPGPAEDLTRRNADVSREQGWNENLARCDQILGDLALAAGDTVTAGRHLATAIADFRAGDHLTDLAEALPSLAACAQATGDLGAAARHLAEAITIAAPRALIPAQATALAARARLRSAHVTATGNTDALAQGRDDADAARRLAVHHHLAWHELDALTAHAILDQAEGTSHGWAAQVGQLRAQLIPPGLDPNPLATVEQFVKEEEERRRQGRRYRH